jgi:hypothetical protein
MPCLKKFANQFPSNQSASTGNDDSHGLILSIVQQTLCKATEYWKRFQSVDIRGNAFLALLSIFRYLTFVEGVKSGLQVFSLFTLCYFKKNAAPVRMNREKIGIYI